MPRLTSISALLFAAAALAAAGCSGPNLASQIAKPPEFNPKDQSKCGVTKSQARPLIVEWPSADRAALESQTRRGMVAVHYIGCEMEVLRQCRAPVSYKYTGITRKRDRVTMRDADELYANIPAYAAKFEGKLQKAGELNVAMTIVGTYEAERADVSKDDLVGPDCAEATHVVTALTAGAFEFFAGAEAEAGAALEAGGLAAGGKSKSQRETLNQDGDDAACEKATSKDSEPPEGCGALLRVEVIPIRPARTGAEKQAAAAHAAAATPAATPAAGGKPALAAGTGGCPAGMALVPGDGGVSAFCMDFTEVTVEAYGECVKAGKCSAEGLRCGSGANWGSASRAAHPINCVTAADSTAYCEANDKRLPTEQEWEWAARGGLQGFDYPWGNDTPSGQLCWGGAGKSSTCAAGASPKGDSPQGVHDLAGNVWEWTATRFEGKGGLRVIRGGSFADSKPELVAGSKRVPNRPDDRNANLGFRCVKTP